MVIAAVSLIVYVTAAFFPGEDVPRYFVGNEADCKIAVAMVRESGIFATDCTPIELPKPKIGGVGA